MSSENENESESNNSSIEEELPDQSLSDDSESLKDGHERDEVVDTENDSLKRGKKKKEKKPFKINLDEIENDFNAKLKKRGVVYLSRIPPRMGPAKVKTLLGMFGSEVTRVYLAEEDKASRKRRRRAAGGNAVGKRYIEGWVEFADKKIAKLVGMQLNNTPISNRKRDVHYGELWCIKYLRNFKWSHLTEKVAYERRVREQKLRVEMMQAKREHAAYAQLVEAGQVMDRIKQRREKAGKNESIELSDSKKRRIRQTLPVDEDGIAVGVKSKGEKRRKKISKAVLSSLA